MDEDDNGDEEKGKAGLMGTVVLLQGCVVSCGAGCSWL